MDPTITDIIIPTWKNGSRDDSGNSSRFCEYCGKSMPIKTLTLFGVEKTFPLYCECHVAEHNRQTEVMRQRNRQMELERYFNYSDLGSRLERCTIDNFISRPGCEDILARVKVFISRLSDQLEAGNGMVLMGGVGNGKTHLAAAIHNQAVAQGYSTVFQHVPTLMYRFNRTYQGEGENEYDLVNVLTSADLLVLDDIGTEKLTEKTAERLFVVLDGRSRWEKSIIVTTNLTSIQVMSQHLGDRALDRLQECCQFVLNRAGSYRQERRQEKQENGRKKGGGGVNGNF